MAVLLAFPLQATDVFLNLKANGGDGKLLGVGIASFGATAGDQDAARVWRKACAPGAARRPAVFTTFLHRRRRAGARA